MSLPFESRMDPDVVALLRGRPAPTEYRRVPVETIRAAVEQRAATPGPAMQEVVDHEVEGTHGPFRVRVYRPTDAPRAPGVLYFHGGGMVVGSVDSFDGFARSMAVATEAVVISVDYHLAPEYPYPVATDEAHDALSWLVGCAGDIGVDASRLAVAGDSAGGTMALGLALRWRDEGSQPALRAQVLCYPGVDEGFDFPSAEEFRDGPVLTLENARWMREQYLGEDRSTISEYAIPARATDLANLPYTILVLAELDLIRDGGEMFASRLRAARVPVAHLQYPGVLHGFITQGVERGRLALRDAAALLSQRFAEAGD